MPKVEILVTHKKDKYYAAMDKLREAGIKFYPKVIDNGGTNLGVTQQVKEDGRTLHHVYEISVKDKDADQANYIINKKAED